MVRLGVHRLRLRPSHLPLPRRAAEESEPRHQRPGRPAREGKVWQHIAIELKIVEARRGDYTQLTSYMGNMQESGVPADKVRGILIAPSFSQKVLNSAAIEPRITLLRFNKGL